MNITACLISFSCGILAIIIGIILILTSSLIGLIPFFLGVLGIILNTNMFTEEWDKLLRQQSGRSVQHKDV